ncbi:MAG TPA: hypothetical protein VEY67_00645 [Candidatus Dormibacteraeota bacterium]|nr:hypothetical protein [Candidatus Dormibacteraeota bacterium]
MDVDAIHGSTEYSVQWASLAGNEQADATTFGFAADSFTFTK